MKPSSSQNPLFTAPNSSVIPDSSSSPPLMSKPEERSKVEWSWEENKVFENAVAEFGAESELLLPTLALRIPTKTISQLKDHLKALEDDTNMIDSSDFDEILELLKSDAEDNDSSSSQLASSMKRKSEQEAAPTKKSEASRSIPRQQRKPTPWTKTEHE
ncbi:hypothetical protein K1719_024580 [Acacia pycnantha]|nr:hypothetical protein K1719_024580 [Acacia pycnantha]